MPEPTHRKFNVELGPLFTAGIALAAYGVFHGTHTGPGGPVPPTGRRASTDYVYVMQFEGDKIVHMTKIWHAGLALKELGWT